MDLLRIKDFLMKNLKKNEKDKNKLYYPSIAGLDFAGFEDFFNAKNPYGFRDILTDTREHLKEIFTSEIYITVHCGETKLNNHKSSKSQWIKNVYDMVLQLQADRLGHALNISDLYLQKLKRKNITIELCPSSNCQISAFSRTPWIESTKETLTYPIKKYFDFGLNITINTDDPAISKTNWTKELFLASELYPNNLSIEDIFKIIHNGVMGSFLTQKNQKN